MKSENAAFLFGRQRFLWRGGELGVFTLIRHASRATFPREGEGFRHWHLHNCTVVSVGAPINLPPWRGKARGGREAPPQAVTDEGEDKMNVGVTPKETWLPN